MSGIERVLAEDRRRGLVTGLLQRLLHDVHFGRRVVHDQDESHIYLAATCVSMADNSSSFVKGFVR